MKIQRPEEVTQIPVPRELSPEELKEAYALAEVEFTINDLLAFTEETEEFPAEEVIAQMDAAQIEADKRSA
jgi:hypothetical protein